MQSIPVFLDITKVVLDFLWNNADICSTQRLCHVIFFFFLDLLEIRYNCAKFHYCRICVIDYKEGGSFAPPHP